MPAFDVLNLNCSWAQLTKGARCERCGFELPRDYDAPPIHPCKSGVRFASAGPCALLGGRTGRTHKRSCYGKGPIAEHRCYHPERRIWLKRPARFADGLCTPRAACHDAKLGIQPCQTCPLYQPQRLLEAGAS